MNKEYESLFTIKNRDLYITNKFSFDCKICHYVVINPKFCSECLTVYCNDCIENYLKSNDTCPEGCSKESLTVSSLKKFQINSLDRLILNCNYGCELPLTEAYSHNNNCKNSKKDIYCWNCNGKTFSTDLKLSEEKKHDIDNNIKTSQSFVLSNKVQNNKLTKLECILELQNNKKELEEEINEIRKKLEIKKQVKHLIDKLYNEFNTGDNVEELNYKLTEKTFALSYKIAEIDRKFNEFNNKTSEISSGNIEGNVVDVDESNDNNIGHIGENTTEYLESLNDLSISRNLVKFKQRVITGHTDFVLNIVKLNDNQIASASADKTIIVWDLLNDTLKPLIGHRSSVRCVIKLNENQLASGSADRTIKIWSLLNFSCEKTLTGHTSSVRCLVLLSSDQIASGSCDCSIKVWDLNTGNSLFRLQHFGSVHCLIKFDENRIISGSADKLIHIWSWDLTNRKIILTLNDHKSIIWCIVKLNDNQIASGSADSSIKIWDLEFGTCSNTLVGHTNAIRSIAKINELKICSGSADFMVKVWDLLTGTCLNTFSEHKGIVFCVVLLNENQIASSSEDMSIRIWDI